MSINAAMFASVVLASRLSTNIQSFALTCCAVQIFALFPLFRRAIKRRLPSMDNILTLLIVLATILAYQRHGHIISVYICVVLMITLAIPALLIHLQSYKLQISGPWDEGKPTVLKRQF
jgi:phosphatidylinositol glycan class C protein